MARWKARPVRGSVLVGAGMLLALVGPAVLWSALQHQLRFQQGQRLSVLALESLAFGGVTLFALGWLLVGAGLWGKRGVLAAAGVYWLVGVVWAVAFNLSPGTPPMRLLHPVVLLLALMWPLQVAQVLGLFGLSGFA